MKLDIPLPLNIAHRGARSLAPENTLAAAHKAYEIGADLWELDTAATADGELVVIHDDTLARTSNAEVIYPERAPWDVSHFTLTELRRLDFGSWFARSDPFGQIAAGKVNRTALVAYAGERILTLEEALRFTRGRHWRVNVEIKTQAGLPGDRFIAERVAELVGELGMAESVLVSSFNHGYLHRVKAANRAIATAALVEEAVDDPAALLSGLAASAYNPGTRAVRLEQIRPLREAGYDVNVWTVNDADEMRRLIEAGVSGLFTDFPQVLKEVLTEYAA